MKTIHFIQLHTEPDTEAIRRVYKLPPHLPDSECAAYALQRQRATQDQVNFLPNYLLRTEHITYISLQNMTFSKVQVLDTQCGNEAACLKRLCNLFIAEEGLIYSWETIFEFLKTRAFALELPWLEQTIKEQAFEPLSAQLSNCLPCLTSNAHLQTQLQALSRASGIEQIGLPPLSELTDLIGLFLRTQYINSMISIEDYKTLESRRRLIC